MFCTVIMILLSINRLYEISILINSCAKSLQQLSIRRYLVIFVEWTFNRSNFQSFSRANIYEKTSFIALHTSCEAISIYRKLCACQYRYPLISTTLSSCSPRTPIKKPSLRRTLPNYRHGNVVHLHVLR